MYSPFFKIIKGIQCMFDNYSLTKKICLWYEEGCYFSSEKLDLTKYISVLASTYQLINLKIQNMDKFELY